MVSTVIAIGVSLTALLKLGDAAAAAIVLASPDSWLGTGLRRGRPVEEDWTPIFARARSQKHRWKQGGREGSGRDVLLTAVVDWMFRAPVLTTLQGVFLLGAVWTMGGQRGKHGGCTFSSHANWLQVVAAILCAGCGVLVIIYFIVTTAVRPRGDDVNQIAGQVILRSAASSARKRVTVFLTVPAMTISMLTSYAAMYLVVFASDHSAFRVTPCAFDAVSALYFSTTTALTVGFGDITPVSDAARALVMSEIFIFVTLLGLFVAAQSTRDGKGARS
jgi:voltage-gated potassium channel